MDCRETRRLLNQGLRPSSYDPLRATLGFHLASCSACRTYRAYLTYRRQMDDQLLHTLVLQPLPVHPQQVASPVRNWRRQAGSRRSQRAWQMAGIAVVLGSMLALSPLNGAAAPAAAPAPAMVQPKADALAADRHVYGGTTQAAVRAETNAERLAAPPPVAPGQQLLIPALPDAPANDQVQQTGPTVYIVQPGDTLSHIALWFYGDANSWPAIRDANPFIANPHLIYPGQRVTIPPIGRGPGPYPGPTQGTYTVQAGDSLWAIAQRTYGDGTRWNEIYQANTGQISNPNLIFPNMVLAMP